MNMLKERLVRFQKAVVFWLVYMIAAIMGERLPSERVQRMRRIQKGFAGAGGNMTILGNLIDMIEGFPAVDLQTAANTGDWISLKNYERVAVVFVSGVGTAGDDPTVVFQQATDNAGSDVKDLDPSSSNVYKKQAATSLASTGQWSDGSGDLSGNDLTNADAAEQALIWWVEIDAAELDVDNGFDHIRATVADVGGNAQPGHLFYLGVPKYKRAPTDVVSAL